MEAVAGGLTSVPAALPDRDRNPGLLGSAGSRHVGECWRRCCEQEQAWLGSADGNVTGGGEFCGNVSKLEELGGAGGDIQGDARC